MSYTHYSQVKTAKDFFIDIIKIIENGTLWACRLFF